MINSPIKKAGLFVAIAGISLIIDGCFHRFSEYLIEPNTKYHASRSVADSSTAAPIDSIMSEYMAAYDTIDVKKLHEELTQLYAPLATKIQEQARKNTESGAIALFGNGSIDSCIYTAPAFTDGSGAKITPIFVDRSPMDPSQKDQVILDTDQGLKTVFFPDGTYDFLMTSGWDIGQWNEPKPVQYNPPLIIEKSVVTDVAVRDVIRLYLKP